MDDTLSCPRPAMPGADAAPVAEVRKVRTDHHLWGTYILLVLVALIELF